jgi:hypothetical protein
MYHNQRLEWSLLETIFFSAFLVTAGENDIAKIMLNSKQNKNFFKKFDLYLCRYLF